MGRERLDVAPLRARIVGEGEVAPVAHAPQPGQVADHVQRVPQTQARRDREAVAQVTLAHAQDLVVDCQHERLVGGRRSAFGHRAGQAAIAVDEGLEPACPGMARGEVLDGDGRAVAHHVDRAGRSRGLRGDELAMRPQQPGETRRPEQHRQGEAAAEQLDAQITLARAVERLREQLDLGQSRLVAAQRALVTGATVAEVEHHARQRALGETAQVGYAVRLTLPTLGGEGHLTRPAGERTSRIPSRIER